MTESEFDDGLRRAGRRAGKRHVPPRRRQASIFPMCADFSLSTRFSRRMRKPMLSRCKKSLSCARKGSRNRSTRRSCWRATASCAGSAIPSGRLVAGGRALEASRGRCSCDEAMPADAREAVETRLLLWVGAHVRKVLGRARSARRGRGARRIPRGRSPRSSPRRSACSTASGCAPQVKGLDQNARAALRKLGVRFGAHYIFVPMLLKPGPRTLCSQLHALKHGAEPGAERLQSRSPRRDALRSPPRGRSRPIPIASPAFACAASAWCASTSSSASPT